MRDEFFGFGADDGADALGTDLNDAAAVFACFHHGHAVGGGMGHGLFAVDVFSGGYGVDHHFFVPEVGDRGDDAVDVFVVEEFLVVAGDGEIGFVGDFAGQRVAAVVQIGCGYAFDAGELDGVGEQAGALHADADDAEADAVIRAGVGCGVQTIVGEKDGVGGCQGAGG